MRTLAVGYRCDDKEVAVIGKNDCLFCKSHGCFKEGPSGGLSQNIYCVCCGAGYNLMGPFGVEIIALPGPNSWVPKPTWDPGFAPLKGSKSESDGEISEKRAKELEEEIFRTFVKKPKRKHWFRRKP